MIALNRTSQSIWWCHAAEFSGLTPGMNVSACSVHVILRITLALTPVNTAHVQYAEQMLSVPSA